MNAYDVYFTYADNYADNQNLSIDLLCEDDKLLRYS